MILKNGRIFNSLIQLFNSPGNRIHFFLVLLFLTPIWLFHYFPSQDGPTHIANALAFLEYFNPEYSVYQTYYVFNYSLTPTWFSHLILASFLSFLSPEYAEKVFLSFYVIFFPIAVNYALRSIRPSSSFLSLLSYPFIYNYLLHLGFYSFCFSLILFFFVMGFWIRHQEQFTLRDTIIFSILSMILYLFHISVWSWTFFGIAILVIWLTLMDYIGQRKIGEFSWRKIWKGFVNRALIPLYACVPVLIMIAAFLVDKQFIILGDEIAYVDRFKKLLAMYSLVSFDSMEILPTVLFSILFAFLVCYFLIRKIQDRDFKRWDGLLLIFVAYVALYMLSPETNLITPNGMEGGGYIDQRLNLFPFFALLLWFAAQDYTLRVKRAIQGVTLSISIALLAVHISKYAELNEYITDYLSGMDLIEYNSTVMGLAFSPLGPTINESPVSKRVELFTHTIDYIAAKRHSVSFSNYEANHGYFPLIYRPELNPYEHIVLNDVDIELPLDARLDFLNYSQHTTGKLDYVLLWGLEEQHHENEQAKLILAQLEKGYEKIHVSPLGLMTLYKLKINPTE